MASFFLVSGATYTQFEPELTKRRKGYDQGVMSGIISARPFNNDFPETKDNSTWQGFVTAIYEVGCLFGAIFALSFGDRLGRRRAIILGGLVMIIGVIIQVSAVPGHNATAQFIIGRTIMGLGNGLNTATIPTYQAECSRTSNRGLLICIEGGIIAFGTLIAYVSDSIGRTLKISSLTNSLAIGPTMAQALGQQSSLGGFLSPFRSSSELSSSQ
jgi:MFS family permease